ncbi:PilW family protein [Marinobacter sp. F4206]|uniref:PilW family protein n=1 Tax=Marinobacter sp. F4206 TaxID=2861777 RepID=UPI001C5F42DD|nr:PilW family protein [Marinobacter sp. F4206]MBW4936402.1 PilW family protein [Marinobacter sp. F4206]
MIMNRYISRMQRHQAGLSLIELMIALVLGLFLSAGVITIFISAKQDYQVQDAISQVQENGRFSLEFLSRDIRMAGFSGCTNEMPTANSIENAPASVGSFEEGIEGFDGDTGTLPAARFPKALSNSDAIILHVADMGSELVVNNHNPNAAQIDVTNAHSFKPGAIMMIVDSNCSNRGIFVMSGPTNTNDNAENVVHNTGKKFTYGSVSNVENCSKALKGEYTCADQSGASSTAYTDGSSVFSITSVGYYIRDPAQDATLTSPTLYRVNFSSEFDTAGTDVYQPLVEGVSDLDVLYGVYDETADTLQYKTADAVTTADEWQSVTTVRLEVEAESLTAVEGAPIQREYVRTVKLRNRG